MMRECRRMAEPGQLPMHPDSAIFVRRDESRMDVLRAVVSGPAGTPYALGLFTFDIFCPPEYPSISPLVHFETTGGGTVKFNPNLYADVRTPHGSIARGGLGSDGEGGVSHLEELRERTGRLAHVHRVRCASRSSAHTQACSACHGLDPGTTSGACQRSCLVSLRCSP